MSQKTRRVNKVFRVVAGVFLKRSRNSWGNEHTTPMSNEYLKQSRSVHQIQPALLGNNKIWGIPKPKESKATPKEDTASQTFVSYTDETLNIGEIVADETLDDLTLPSKVESNRGGQLSKWIGRHPKGASEVDVHIHHKAPSMKKDKTAKALRKKNFGDYRFGGPLSHKIARPFVVSTVRSLLHRWTKEPPTNLIVRSDPMGNVLGRFFLNSEFASDIQIEFDRIVFGNIRISGGRIDANRLALDTSALTPQITFNRRNATTAPKRRFASPFEFHAQNCIFTQDDLLESNCIRNGLANLAKNVLKSTGLHTCDVTITSIKILRSSKLSISGTATTGLGMQVPFRVRSGIAASDSGHVLNFPGLEIALNYALFMPVVPHLHLDIGSHAKVEELSIDGITRNLTISARVTVTPEEKIKLNYVQDRDSYLAHYSCDVGRFITRIGKFSATI
eukprot:scaffold71946_cov58-Attheya_sp.AAC.2